jgi:hypothetical protein
VKFEIEVERRYIRDGLINHILLYRVHFVQDFGIL